MPNVRKILFIAEGYLGDSLVLTPALKAAKEQIKDAKITVLLLHRQRYADLDTQSNTEIQKSDFRGTAAVFKNNPFIDEVLELDRKAIRALKGIARIKTEIKCIKFLKKQKFDTVICTFPQDRFVIWSYLAGIKTRIGQKKQKFHYLLTHKPDIERSDSGVLKYFCSLLKPLNVVCSSAQTFYNIPPEAKVKADNFFTSNKIDGSKKIIVIHPGASYVDRQWPPQNYAELINNLNSKHGLYEIILCFSKYDFDFIEKLKNGLKERITEIQTETIADLAAVLVKCDLAVVHNSGPRHLAAAIGTSTLALLEKHDDINWKIYENQNKHVIVQSLMPCSSCGLDKCLGTIPNGGKYGARCIHDINVKDIYSRIETLVNNN